MKHIVPKPAWLVAIAAAMLMGHAQAKNAPAQDGAAKSTSKASVKKKSGTSGQVRFLPGSEETTRDRSKRLQRECKGRVNAGACAGYTG